MLLLKQLHSFHIHVVLEFSKEGHHLNNLSHHLFTWVKSC